MQSARPLFWLISSWHWGIFTRRSIRSNSYYNLALWDFAWNCPYMGALRLGKPAIAFKIKVETLKQSCVLENTVTTSLSCFDLIVQALYEAAAKTTGKVVDDFVEPVIECGQELIKASQGALTDFVLPSEE